MEWVMRSIGSIPTQKYVSDLRLVQDMDYCFKTLKSSVLMYPEAGYSFDGCATPLQQMAAISVPEPRTLLITPWDKSSLKDIEKAIDLCKMFLLVYSKNSSARSFARSFSIACFSHSLSGQVASVTKTFLPLIISASVSPK